MFSGLVNAEVVPRLGGEGAERAVEDGLYVMGLNMILEHLTQQGRRPLLHTPHSGGYGRVWRPWNISP